VSENDEDIIREFLAESQENLERLDRDLVALEADPSSPSILGSAFRTLHTLKGTCGFLGFARLEAVAHAGETLLARLRDGALTLTPGIAGVLLVMVDTVRAMLAAIEDTRAEGEGDDLALLESLRRAAAGDAPAGAGRAARAGASAPAAAAPEVTPVVAAAGASAAAAPTPPAPPAHAPGAVVEGPPPRDHQGMFETLVRAGRLDRESIELAARLQLHGDPRRIGEILVDMGVLQPDDVLQALKEQAEQAGRTAVTASASVRVDVDLLERLMNRVGELVLARNQLLLMASGDDWTGLPAASQRINLVTTELQEAIMLTRMQPIRTLWGRMPRLVRDLASTLGKRVRLEMTGHDTGLDRSVIEAVKDPLTHLVRNAVDHGIETPEARLAAGKPGEGLLRLRAYHESGQVHVEVTDDGAGIAVNRIRARALERGLVPEGEVDRMTDADWLNLIFLPGFSTAEKVSNVSGRGVGMDVVKSNLEKIGGAVAIESRPGAGTTMKIQIPLTLAIIPALRVVAGGEDYALPQANLLELIRLQGEAAARAVERVQDARVYRLRGQLLPLVDLDECLGVTPAGARQDTLTIAVVQCDGRPFGLVVDAVGDTREIIVKPLGRLFAHVGLYAGATILGDGRVALILDVPGLARSAGIQGERSRLVLLGAAAAAESAPAARPPLLVFEVREGWRCAAPLSGITRIERFDPRTIESLGDRDVVQYRGRIVPVIPLATLLDPDGPAARVPGRVVPALVCEHRGATVALAVERIVDIEAMDEVRGSAPAGTAIVASFVIGDRATDVLDLDAVLARVPAELLAPPAAAGSAS
jgi:two-component system, chemotaxis family, sensor kinase CheA